MIKFHTIILFLFCLISCKSNNEKNIQPIRPGKNDLIDLNKYLVQKDRERILNYIERKNLEMTESSSGLWFRIKQEGTGKFLTDNDHILMEYDCSLIDGTKCYSSKTVGLKEIILGRSQLEPGLNEGLRMLKQGAEAIFILPPYLAFGLIGDGKKIPSRAVIVYNVIILHAK